MSPVVTFSNFPGDFNFHHCKKFQVVYGVIAPSQSTVSQIMTSKIPKSNEKQKLFMLLLFSQIFYRNMLTFLLGSGLTTLSYQVILIHPDWFSLDAIDIGRYQLVCALKIQGIFSHSPNSCMFNLISIQKPLISSLPIFWL